MSGKYTKDSVLVLLTEKQATLREAGEARYPQRKDFKNDEVCAIKAFLGPWPRALEAAGLKPPRDDGHAQRVLEKRIRMKRRKTAFIKNGSDPDPSTDPT